MEDGQDRLMVLSLHLYLVVLQHDFGALVVLYVIELYKLGMSKPLADSLG